MKSGEVLEGHAPEDQPAKRAEQQIFQRKKRQVQPGRWGQEDVQFLPGSFCKIRGQANRADPPAEALAQEEAEKQGGQKDGEAGRMDGVVFSGQNKPFQADQGAKGEKGLDRRWALNELL